MSLLNSVLKVFVGDKSKQDVKSIMPIVNEIKRFELPSTGGRKRLVYARKAFPTSG